MSRESFVIHTEYIEDLPEANKAEFLLYIYNYGSKGEEPELDGLVQTIWVKIKRRMDAEEDAYNTRLKGNAAGGSKHKGNQYSKNGSQLPKLPKEWKSMEVSGSHGSDNDSVNEFVNEIEHAQEESCACSAPAETPVLKIQKSEFDPFLKWVFDTICEHNKSHAPGRKLPISRNFITFKQSEGRQLCNVLHEYDAVDIKTALTNYLHVADMDTWKSSFSFQAFCTHINEYTAEYFSPDKFEKNENKRPAIEYVKQFIHDKLAETKFPIDVAVFIYHRKDWLSQGRPDGAEYLKLQKQWEIDDRAAGVDYEKANDGWESNT